MANAYVSINWHVKRGSEEQFLEVWGAALAKPCDDVRGCIGTDATRLG